MRYFFVFIIIALTAIFIGFKPQPLFKPDWQSSYKSAIASNDCDQISRIIELLFIVGLDSEGHAEVYRNHQAGRCEYADLPEEEVEIAKVLGSIEERTFDRNNLNLDFSTSYIGLAYKYINREKLPARHFVRKLERDLSLTYLKSCYRKISPIMGGYPNYELLQFALSNPNLSLEKIASIARSQRSACAKTILAKANIIASVATTPEEFSTILHFLWTVYILSYENPELAPELEQLEKLIPDEAYELAHIIKEEPIEFSFFSCDILYADRLLERAIKCAIAAESASGTVPKAEIQALYYSLRAKRLGWNDVNLIEENAVRILGAECRNAIIQKEQLETQDATEPRDFVQLPWPIHPGEPCGPATIDATPNAQ